MNEPLLTLRVNHLRLPAPLTASHPRAVRGLPPPPRPRPSEVTWPQLMASRMPEAVPAYYDSPWLSPVAEKRLPRLTPHLIPTPPRPATPRTLSGPGPTTLHYGYTGRHAAVGHTSECVCTSLTSTSQCRWNEYPYLLWCGCGAHTSKVT